MGDRILGLNTGADDDLAQPFDLDELEALVRALARRGSAANVASFCGMHCATPNGAVYFNGEPMDLAPRESALLRPLLAQACRAVTRERLFELVFPGQTPVQPETIEVVAYRHLDFEQAAAATPVRAHEWALRELARKLLHNANKRAPEGSPLFVPRYACLWQRIEADEKHLRFRPPRRRTRSHRQVVVGRTLLQDARSGGRRDRQGPGQRERAGRQGLT